MKECDCEDRIVDKTDKILEILYGSNRLEIHAILGLVLDLVRKPPSEKEKP